MGKEVRGLPEDPSLSEGSPEGGRIGSYLARQRRLRGISLEELAERTKLPLRSLERLESGAFDTAPDGFARGFVRSVAGALGLDVDEAVMRLLHEPPEEESSRAASRASLRQRAALVGLVVAAVAVLFGLWKLGSALIGWVGRDESEVTLEYRQDAVRDLAGTPSRAAPAAPAAPAAAGESAPPHPLDSAGGVHPD